MNQILEIFGNRVNFQFFYGDINILYLNMCDVLIIIINLNY